MIITRTINGQSVVEEDLKNHVIKHPAVLQTIDAVRRRTNNAKV